MALIYIATVMFVCVGVSAFQLCNEWVWMLFYRFMFFL